MLKINNYNYAYFYGEFGCLNYAILGHLEEEQPSIMVSTQPDYFELMKIKCPKIKKTEDKEIYRANCIGAGFGLSAKDEKINELKKQGFKPLNEILKFQEKKCINYIKPIKVPLKFDCGLTKQYISVSFRKRTHEPERNLSIKDWKTVIEIIKNQTDLEIIAHGMDIDTYDFGFYKPKTIHESIAYLNASKIFIASMSGIAQFASNCACSIIQIGNPKRHIEYDPFQKGAIAVEKQNFKEVFLSIIK